MNQSNESRPHPLRTFHFLNSCRVLRASLDSAGCPAGRSGSSQPPAGAASSGGCRGGGRSESLQLQYLGTLPSTTSSLPLLRRDRASSSRLSVPSDCSCIGSGRAQRENQRLCPGRSISYQFCDDPMSLYSELSGKTGPSRGFEKVGFVCVSL